MILLCSHHLRCNFEKHNVSVRFGLCGVQKYYYIHSEVATHIHNASDCFIHWGDMICSAFRMTTLLKYCSSEPKSTNY